jgi:hypothetical protein
LRFSAIGKTPHGVHDFDVYIGNLYPSLMQNNYIATFTLVVRRHLKAGLPRFPVDLPTFEDWQFFGELSRQVLGAYLDVDTAINHGHGGPRLSNAAVLVQAESRLRVLERVWGRDGAFLAQAAASYEAVVTGVRAQVALSHAKDLMKAGRMREARQAFAALGGCPMRYVWALHVPGPVARLVFRLATTIRQLDWLQ